MSRRTAALALAAAMAFGCAARPVVKEGVDVWRYRKIGVVDFVSFGFFYESGAAVADEFVRKLMVRQIEVVRISRSDADGVAYDDLARRHNVDAILTGTVTKYSPDVEDRLFFRDARGDIVSEMVLRDAQAGASVMLIDGETGGVVWTDSYSYRGFEIDNTIHVVADVIARRMFPKY